MATKGGSARLTVSPTAGGAGVYTAVADIDTVSIEMDGQNVDVTTLTDADMVRIQAMRDCKLTASGNMATDTNGQGAIRTAYTGDSTLWFKFLWDGSVGYKALCKVAKINIGASATGKVTVSYDLEASGAITAV